MCYLSVHDACVKSFRNVLGDSVASFQNFSSDTLTGGSDFTTTHFFFFFSCTYLSLDTLDVVTVGSTRHDDKSDNSDAGIFFLQHVVELG